MRSSKSGEMDLVAVCSLDDDEYIVDSILPSPLDQFAGLPADDGAELGGVHGGISGALGSPHTLAFGRGISTPNPMPSLRLGKQEQSRL